MPAQSTLQYDQSYWLQRLGNLSDLSLEAKLHLLFSLLIYLNLPLVEVLKFAFTSPIEEVRRRAGSFMGYWKQKDEDSRFPPQVIYQAWHENFPRSRRYLHSMITGCAKEIVLEESNKLIQAPELKVQMKNVTTDTFEGILTPGKLSSFFKEHAPFVWGLLDTFSASPNQYRKKKRSAQWDEILEEIDDDPNFDESDPSASRSQGASELRGFSRNPELAILTSISMLAFVRNRATNVLPLVCGTFCKIEGTSSRVANMLGNIGLCVSSKTIERVKEKVTDDAIIKARALMSSGRPFVTIFDNLNFYLRKFQQRITNRNTMLNVTNCAILGVNGEGVDVDDALNLDEHLKRRGGRSKANFKDDIMPTADDGQHLRAAFKFIIADFIVRYSPESKNWDKRNGMLEDIASKMPHDEPLKAEKTDTRPFGVFDVNEGSKKGIIQLLDAIRQRAHMTVEEWSEKLVRILGGDWLTSNNIRAARRDRRDDVDRNERLEYGQEVSELFHFALQATEQLMRAHYGQPLQDPTSLGAQKGLLGRVWDVNSANYAAAKSLIRHSLIARILHIVMVHKGFHLWSELASWRPSLDEVYELAEVICKEYATTESAKQAKDAKDDWNAHDRYFIRDALLFCEFECSVSWADPPAILRILRYWCLAFRGAGQHNYSRECAEILLKWKYEISPQLRKLLERSWFVNRWGREGCWIAADLYLEQLNLLVKRVFIAQGSGVTADYIIRKGSACVEIFRQVSHLVSSYFGSPERRRKSKEISFQEDLRLLVEEMERHQIHKEYQERIVPVMRPVGKRAPKARAEPTSAIFDIQVKGAEIWQDGKFSEFIKATTYDDAVGYPVGIFADPDGSHELDNDTVFDRTDQQDHLSLDKSVDVFGDESAPGWGGIGGGQEFDTGEEAN